MLDLLALGTGFKYGIGLALAFKVVGRADEQAENVIEAVKDKVIVEKTLWEHNQSPTKEVLQDLLEEAHASGQKAINQTIDVTKDVIQKLQSAKDKKPKQKAVRRARTKTVEANVG